MNLNFQKLMAFTMLLLAAQSSDAQSIYIPVDSSAASIVNFTLSGGALQSYGCDGLDPTYWMSGSGNSITVNFVNAQTNPSIRVWGMNDDDVAEVLVNAEAYPLSSTSASYAPKVICNQTYGSPGVEGVLFSGGMLVGANANSLGNYSYQDVTLQVADVNSIMIVGVSGAGWGVAGVTVANDLSSVQSPLSAKMNVALYPNPTNAMLTISGIEDADASAELFNVLGVRVLHQELYSHEPMTINLGQVPQGAYFLTITTAYGTVTEKVWKH